MLKKKTKVISATLLVPALYELTVEYEEDVEYREIVGFKLVRALRKVVSPEMSTKDLFQYIDDNDDTYMDIIKKLES